MREVDELSFNVSKIDSVGRDVDSIVSSIVEKCCGELDRFISDSYRLVSNKDVDIQDVDIEYIVLQIPCLVYFASSLLEDVGIREDISKKVEKEVYNNTILSVEGRVSEKESSAQIAVQKDALVTMVYSRAYKKIRSRIDCALEALGSFKKVLANRISEKELSRRDRQ